GGGGGRLGGWGGIEAPSPTGRGGVPPRRGPAAPLASGEARGGRTGAGRISGGLLESGRAAAQSPIESARSAAGDGAGGVRGGARRGVHPGPRARAGGNLVGPRPGRAARGPVRLPRRTGPALRAALGGGGRRLAHPRRVGRRAHRRRAPLPAAGPP